MKLKFKQEPDGPAKFGPCDVNNFNVHYKHDIYSFARALYFYGHTGINPDYVIKQYFVHFDYIFLQGLKNSINEFTKWKYEITKLRYRNFRRDIKRQFKKKPTNQVIKYYLVLCHDFLQIYDIDLLTFLQNELKEYKEYKESTKNTIEV